jgi:hypothetical protein
MMPLRPRAQSAQKDKKSAAVEGERERSSCERYLSSVSQSIYQQLAMAQAGGGQLAMYCPNLGLFFEPAHNKLGVKVTSVTPGGLAETAGGFMRLSPKPHH